MTVNNLIWYLVNANEIDNYINSRDSNDTVYMSDIINNVSCKNLEYSICGDYLSVGFYKNDIPVIIPPGCKYLLKANTKDSIILFLGGVVYYAILSYRVMVEKGKSRKRGKEV